jgi:hypothetical protein
MNTDDVLERRLTTHLREQSMHAPGSDGWHAILARVDRRHRRRQGVRIGATALCLLTLIGTLVLLPGTGSEQGRVASGPPVPPFSGRLPHLVLGLPGYELEHASEAYFGPEAAAAPVGPRLSLLTTPGEGYDGPVLFVTTAPAVTPYGVGDQSSSASRVDVGGRTAWLQQYTGMPVTSLGWRLDDGRAVHFLALRIDEDELVAAARTAVVADDGTVSWPEGSLPSGLALRRSTETPTGPRATAEVGYRRGESRYTLRLQQGGDAVLDDLIRDRAASALEIGDTTVDGVPAVLSVYQGDDGSSLMWPVRPGVVAELVASGSSAQADLVATAALVTEIDEAGWQELLDRHAPRPQPPSPDGAGRMEAVIESMCDLRGDWLAADEAGRAELVRLMGALRRHAVETGLDRNSDIGVVLDRLVAAMSAGDATAVRSIPDGSACG